MNRNKLKAYAPQARRDFIKAVTDRAAYYGLTKDMDKVEAITQEGDVAIIAGKPFPRAVTAKRKRLEEQIRRQGFDQVMEAMAYTWFNRFVAIRFMELHGCLDHGYRVLSTTNDTNGKSSKSAPSVIPDLLKYAEHVDLPGLDREKVIELKLEGTKEAELYRMLLVAQFNALHKAMPFLFEWINDATELLLPENLLHSDSVIRKLVKKIPEEDWREVEIIGWLYQFYISEKKDQVIGKVVKSEDIPAATQLFTPNWIVKYMVQNTLGQQWMATYPNSSLKQQMEFYIQPAEQTPEVQEQLKAITPDSLNPEELTLLDPACGSGHILVEAYDLLKAIYQERGYRKKDIPRLILEKNLYGLEIDDRSAQLAAFALMMKARADDRHIFENGTQPHVLAIQESKGLDAGKMTEALNEPILKMELLPREFLFEEMEEERAPLFSRKRLSIKGEISQADVAQLIDLFEHGKTFGSLIRVPEDLAEKLSTIAKRVEDVLAYGDMFGQATARAMAPLVEQAMILARKYDVVVLNPPYMGSKFFEPTLKSFVNEEYTTGKADLYGVFILRANELSRHCGMVALITIPNWMFLSTFEGLRKYLLQTATIDSFVHNGRGVWGSDFGSCAFTLRCCLLASFTGNFKRLFSKQGSVSSNDVLRSRFFTANMFTVSGKEFEKVPGVPISYWVSGKLRDAFVNGSPLRDTAPTKVGQNTGDNDRFLRRWFEVDHSSIAFKCRSIGDAQKTKKKWFPYNKGGQYRRWYGNNEFLINWENDGAEVKEYAVVRNKGKHWSRYLQNLDYVFQPGITWSFISSSYFGVRIMEEGFIFDVAGSSAFPSKENMLLVLGLLCSKPATSFMATLNPSLNFQAGNVASIPIVNNLWKAQDQLDILVDEAVELAKLDWNSSETSWEFQQNPLFLNEANLIRIQDSTVEWTRRCETSIRRMKYLEDEINRHVINAYGLQDELSLEVSEDQITLARPNREEDIKRLISYAIGCMLGRYSLDKPGLIYAHTGNEGFDVSQYRTFPADQDGIIPITDADWFEDDAANRIVEFIHLAWPNEHLEENLISVAESLGPNRGESHRETIRRYLSTGFYKHHLSMYKKRPIYWLFSSGKQRAFQCLVYLHRYSEGTLSRMRTEYVIPLQGKINARIEQLRADVNATTSTSHRKKLEREGDKLVKQQVELQAFDEKLRHYADQRITLDLDDGVKVNYGKFGYLLAEVKAVTGKKAE